MKVSAIKNFSYNSDKTETLSYQKTVSDEPENTTPAAQKVYAGHLGFRGGIPLTNLVNDYKWFINHDKLPAINAFFKINAPKESMKQLLRHILANKEYSYAFIDSISSQPRNVTNFYQMFKERLPWDSDVFNMYAPNNLYIKAYEAYIDERYKNAESVSELLKIRPDWKEEVLLNKHRELYHNDDFELGIVPESIGAENFPAIAEHLRRECTYGFKKPSEVPDLTVNGKTFNFKRYLDGKSDKNVFKIKTPDGGRFVIKMTSSDNNNLNQPGSLGLVSIIDTYLTRNNCRNAAPIRYYNRNNNIAIYDYINHNKVDQIRFSISELLNKIPDIKDLGITIYDTIGSNNYFRLDDSQRALQNSNDFTYGILHDEVISVDNDHATYDKILFPSIDKYHKAIQNEIQMFF